MPTVRVAEVRQQPVKKVVAWQEIGVEDGDEGAARDLQPGFERPGLVAGAIGHGGST